MLRRQHDFMRLGVDNLPTYLEHIRAQLPFSFRSLRRIEEVGEYSNNNFVFRLMVGHGKRAVLYYLKQAQPYNRRSVQQGKPIAVHPGRMGGEVKLLRRLARLWHPETVPHVFFYDLRHHVMLMSDVGRGGKILIEEFAHDRVHPEIGKLLGTYLGKLHASTYKTRETTGTSRVWHDRITQWLFGVHFASGAHKHFSHREVGKFYKEVNNCPFSIVWGDPVHRNIFVKPKAKVGLVDFDHTVKYDPMLDVGMLLAHWVWMWLKGKPRVSRDCEVFLRQFSRTYWNAWRAKHKLTSVERSAMYNRLTRWIGLYLLSRTDGSSGSYFKKWPAWERRVRHLGLVLFAERRNPLTTMLAKLIVSL